MKNVHLLPTDNQYKGSISLTPDGRLSTNILIGIPQNIYITNDSEIKEGVDQWYLDKFLNKPRNSGGAQYSQKQDVIIMTTDADLIADGVQAIDDKLLEWFVKNPGCERVETKSQTVINYSFPRSVYYKHETIIPQEEFKQELLPDFRISKDIFDFVTDLPNYSAEIPRQKTLEEAALEYAKNDETKSYDFTISTLTDAFEAGAGWQNEYINSTENMVSDEIKAINIFSKGYDAGAEDYEKMYSENEVKFIISEALQSALAKLDLEQWFKQHKK
jgi:hypothetical protein